MNAKNQYCTGIYYVYIPKKLHKYFLEEAFNYFLYIHVKIPATKL